MSLREAIVDLAAVRANAATIAARAGVPVMAVVKADGYGHGAVEIARAALEGGAAWLGVADLDEALRLRAAGLGAPILAWIHGQDSDFAAAVDARVQIGVSTLGQLDRAAAHGADVQLKTDTGLSRNGFADAEAPAAFAAAAELQRRGRLRVTGVFSHLANAGEAEDTAQLMVFHRQLAAARAAGLEPAVTHLASTAAALTRPDAAFDLVRVGIGLYGLSPWSDGAALGLVPAMRVTAEVVAVRRVPAGTGVSYGFDYRAQRPTTLALIAMGYADGVPRQASNRGPVAIRGSRYTVAGRIAMDQFVVDVGDDEIEVGDRAVLFGDPATGAPSADDWGAASGSINYEVVTRIGARVRRVHRG